jgi:D-hexose-6-phosphate mutarotase
MKPAPCGRTISPCTPAFKLGKTCEIELEAHGEFETTSALHTYFNVGDISAVKVSGLGDTFIDKVDNAKEGKLSDGVQAFLTVPTASICTRKRAA